jgi:hypothetical protein
MQIELHSPRKGQLISKQKGKERTSLNMQPSLFPYGTKMNIRLRIPLQHQILK